MADTSTIHALKGLIIDGVHQAKSGHPGGAMSSLDFAYILFTEYLQFDPDDSRWLGRDRFVLSAGHESMLLYALLHANGWLPMDELKRFRQLGSKTPGHPENILTPGVECTTGPLGQGAAMSVGMAMAAKHLAATLDEELFSHQTYTLLGDGCMQEEVTLGAASLAGHWGLSNLVWYYDRNRCQISGEINRVTSDDEKKIFEGFGWRVLEIDGHDHQQIRKALDGAKAIKDQPLLIIGNTVMAHGAASMEGQHGTHGAPLPEEERKATKAKFGLPADQDFYWPEEAAKHYQRNFAAARSKAQAWRKTFADKRKADSDFDKAIKHGFEKERFEDIPAVAWDKSKAIATRKAFGDVLKGWATSVPNLVGGSADLEPSNMTGAFAKAVGDFQKDSPKGRNLAFGVREFPMSAIANGIALHGGLIPFDATFLTFSDYARPALRLGALQEIRVIHEYTHDSFYLGEDGPTHQPIEHVMSLRLMPELYVMRPADPVETEALMNHSLSLHRPTCHCLTRQGVPYIGLDTETVKSGAVRGAYVVKDTADADLILIATGSEVGLALEASKTLESTHGYKPRVVSMPCWELFDQQDAAYKNEVLPTHIQRRISIEAGSTLGWQRWVGHGGLMIGIDHFGQSGPAGDLAKAFGFTPEAVVGKVLEHNFS